MCGIVLCLSVAAMGVDYGWQPVAGGGIEYIIQIEPQLLDALKSGHDIFSDLPRSVQEIRSYRITVGNGRLPHHGEPPPDSAVVPAGGTTNDQDSQEATAGERQSADIDLSQLPGPVLGPAFPGDAPMIGEAEEEEPPHLAEADAGEPIENRVAGYHETQDRQDIEKPQIEQSDEPESPSDREHLSSDPAPQKQVLWQLGLFTSLCCNAFLLWVATGERSRYRALLRRMFDTTGRPPAIACEDPKLPRWEGLPAAEQRAAPADPGTPS